MTAVSNDPALLPFVSSLSISSYFIVVSSTMVLYDWVLTFRQEFELVWMQHWSFMTVLYVCVRYIGILYSVIIILWNIPHSLTDVHNDCNSCLIVYFIWEWTPIVANAILGVIMMIRIHAMYGRSKKMLACLVLVLLASTIASVVMVAIANIGVSAEEFIPLGFHICLAIYDNMNQVDLIFESMISTAIWEILTFILAFWVVLKHFRELRQSPTGPTIGDCFMVLTKSHAFYFVVFAVVACFTLGSTSTNIIFAQSVGSEVYICTLQVAQALQMFVLGPRLILSIRKYHAKLVARSDEEIGMTTIRFQAGGDVSTSGDV